MQSQRKRSSSRTPEDLFGQALREFRKKVELTQEELAFQSGYHPTYIGQLERGKKSPSLRAIMNLAPVLKTTASQLVERVELLVKESTVRAQPRKG